jgi:hypothetical protein
MVAYLTGQNGHPVPTAVVLWSDIAVVRTQNLHLVGESVLNCLYRCAYVEPAQVIEMIHS